MPPTPDEIKNKRENEGLTQKEAAALIYSKLRTWQDWEAGKAKMHAGLWELFLLKVKLVSSDNAQIHYWMQRATRAEQAFVAAGFGRVK